MVKRMVSKDFIVRGKNGIIAGIDVGSKSLFYCIAQKMPNGQIKVLKQGEIKDSRPSIEEREIFYNTQLGIPYDS